MNAFAQGSLALVVLFALYMVTPMLGFTGLAGAFAYVFVKRARSQNEQRAFASGSGRSITSLT